MYLGSITKPEFVKKALIGSKLQSLKMIIINVHRKLMSNYYYIKPNWRFKHWFKTKDTLVNIYYKYQLISNVKYV